MPYIDMPRRVFLEGHPTAIPETPGELNYKITRLCLEYFKCRGGRYQQINDVVGVLECAKMEFYRRAAAPYEDSKIIIHGDVF